MILIYRLGTGPLISVDGIDNSIFLVSCVCCFDWNWTSPEEVDEMSYCTWRL